MLAYLALWFSFGPAIMIAINLKLFKAPEITNEAATMSVVIPARNEEANIIVACRCVLASEGVNLDLVVVDDHSTDATAAKLASIIDPRLRVIQPSMLPAGWVGKPHACLTGARNAQHELIVFLDADVRVTPDALSRIASFVNHRNVSLASGFPCEVCFGFSDGLLLPLIHFVLLGFLPIAMMRRSSKSSLGAGCGQLIAVRRKDYWHIGGHEAVCMSKHDGITLPRAFRSSGFMTDIFDASRLAHCRMYNDQRGLLEGLLKNATEGMAKPVALPVWTFILIVGQVVPFLLLVAAPDWTAFCAAIISLGSRLALAIRFKSGWWSAFLQPIAVAAFLALQWLALYKHLRGQSTTWRDRAYAP